MSSAAPSTTPPTTSTTPNCSSGGTGRIRHEPAAKSHEKPFFEARHIHPLLLQKGLVLSRLPEERLVASEARKTEPPESINQTRKSSQDSRAIFLKEPSKQWPKRHHNQRKTHHAEGNRKEKRRQKRIIEEKESVFQLVDHHYRDCELNGD